MEEEPCGVTYTIDGTDIMAWGKEEPIRQSPDVVLVCSRPLNHTPPNLHSDGVTDWLGEEIE